MSRLEIVSKKTGKTLGVIDENAGTVEISETWANQPKNSQPVVNTPGAVPAASPEKDPHTDGND